MDVQQTRQSRLNDFRRMAEKSFGRLSAVPQQDYVQFMKHSLLRGDQIFALQNKKSHRPFYKGEWEDVKLLLYDRTNLEKAKQLANLYEEMTGKSMTIVLEG